MTVFCTRTKRVARDGSLIEMIVTWDLRSTAHDLVRVPSYGGVPFYDDPALPLHTGTLAYRNWVRLRLEEKRMSNDRSGGRPDERNRAEMNGLELQSIADGALQLGSSTRRSLIRAIGAGGLLTSVATATAAAQGNGAGNGKGGERRNQTGRGRESLPSIEVNYAIYAWKGEQSPDVVYPGSPMAFGSDDPEDDNSLFDSSDLKWTSNRNTLHHGFRFTPGHQLVGKPKPYTLVHEGGGKYRTRGQVVNFRLTEDVSLPFPNLPEGDFPEGGTFAEGRYRAVARETIALIVPDVWAVTRVEFYTRGRGEPELLASLLYLLGTETFLPKNDIGIPIADGEDFVEEVDSFITAGPANQGGQ